MNAGATLAEDALAIRRACLLDLPAIHRLEQACFPDDAYDLVTLLGIVLNPAMVRLKAVLQGKLVGFAAGEARPRDEMGWIVTLGVLPSHQGQGIGRVLLVEAEHALNVPRVKLTVRRSNARAIALYERCGYRYSGTARGYYHDGEDGLIMEKRMW